jgi:hypothetical protein
MPFKYQEKRPGYQLTIRHAPLAYVTDDPCIVGVGTLVVARLEPLDASRSMSKPCITDRDFLLS